MSLTNCNNIFGTEKIMFYVLIYYNFDEIYESEISIQVSTILIVMKPDLHQVDRRRSL